MEHFYQGIPGFFAWPEFYAQQVERARDGAHFVEVGAFLGQSTAWLAVEIINSGKSIKLDVVDLWPDEYGDHLIDSWVKEHGNARAHFDRNMERVKDVMTVHQMSSTDAAALYNDHSLDFVFIDGAHDYESVKADLRAWYPKVRLDGVLAGDDYNKRAVELAVREHFAKFAVQSEAQKYWITGGGMRV